MPIGGSRPSDKGGGGEGVGGHLEPEIRGLGLKKKFSQPFGPQLGLKRRRGGGGAGPLGLSPGSATDASLFFSHSLCVLWHSNCKGNQNSSDGHCNGVFSYPTTTLD